MAADQAGLAAASLLDKRTLQAAGVLLPIQLQALSFFSGRHPLGRAGEGMRFLRTREFDAGQDNPRDIDKFSPPGEYLVTDWEAEAQASILLYTDFSASMKFAAKSAVLNQLLMQLTYSLWRATDRVRTVLYDSQRRELVGERNLKRQLEELMRHLQDTRLVPGQDVTDVLAAHRNNGASRADLVFVLSDFCPVAADAEVADLATWRVVLRSAGCDVIPIVISFELAEGQRGCVRL